MKKIILLFWMAAISLSGPNVFCQTEDSESLGLPGDNLDLYAVLDIFQKSKTIEDFEKALNEKKSGVNNLDLDLDKKVDFIKVITEKKDASFAFVLQVAVSKTETQDVAVILVDKDKNGKVSLQIVGDKDLYGKDYVIEPKATGSPAVTANPGYVGSDPVKSAPATTTVVVETVPIVQYVYSPAYVPYYPPYYYGYYPPYFAAFTVMAVGIYRHNHYHHHAGYHGGHYGGGNTVIINNKNNFNNYNKNKMSSKTVSNNRANNKYGNSATNRASSGASNRASNTSSGAKSNRNSSGPSAGTSNRASAGTSNRASAGSSGATRSSQNLSSGAGRTTNGSGMGGGGSRSGGMGGRRR